MERRDFVKSGLTGAALGLVASSVVNAGEQEHNHAAMAPAAVRPVNAELKKVAETAYACLTHATACIAECNVALAAGETDMAQCQQAVLSMVPVCEATAENATLNLVDEKLLRNLVEVCRQFCDYCADACEAHAEHYKECKNCMESCKTCSEACVAYLKA